MSSGVNDLTVLFLSILIESLPFLLLGSLIASLIGIYVSDSLVYRLIPKNLFGGLIAASLLGLVFPVCDCTIIPIVRRLMRKGLPMPLAVTFMCAVPIVNPSVIASTAWAFGNRQEIMWLRLLVGIISAIGAGFLMSKIMASGPALRHIARSHGEGSCECGHHEDPSHACCGGGGHAKPAQSVTEVKHTGVQRILQGVYGFVRHATDEYLDNIALVIAGALVSAAIQILVPRTVMYPVSTSPVLSVGFMMGFTYIISLCSNADAFVAKSFYGLFTTGSVIAFMTFGQMIDLKNTVLMLGAFRKRFVALFIAVVGLLCLAWGISINLIGGVR